MPEQLMFDFGEGPVPARKHANGGGWVALTAAVTDSAFVGYHATVYGNAWVYGNAKVYGNAHVYGNAYVYGNAWVYGNAKVYGNAHVYGNANVYGNAWVYGNANVYGNAWVYGNAHVYENAAVYGNSWVSRDFYLPQREKPIADMPGTRTGEASLHMIVHGDDGERISPIATPKRRNVSDLCESCGERLCVYEINCYRICRECDVARYAN